MIQLRPSHTFALRTTFILTLLCLNYAFVFERNNDSEEAWYKHGIEDPDVDRNVSQLITSKGYDVEEHWIQTEDGYVIGIQRIPRPRSERRERSLAAKPAVLLMHGIAESSADWVWNFPNQSLGFILADGGYDVWLGNVRGNEYGQNHVSLSTTSEEFWAYSWDEMAKYDLKSMLIYVTTVTRTKTVRIVGFSLGINIVMALLSEQPRYQKMVHSVVAMAPAVYIRNMRTELNMVLPSLTRLATLVGIDTFGLFSKNSPTNRIPAIVCGNRLIRPLCKKIIPMITGPSSNQQLNYTRLAVYLSKIPSGISFRMIKHSVQQGTGKVFCKYDFGKKENRVKYGQDTPPIYPLDKVKIPIAILYGSNDRMAPPTDVQRFKDELLNARVLAFHRIQYDKWSHMDFVWGLETYKYVYSRVLEYLKF